MWTVPTDRREMPRFAQHMLRAGQPCQNRYDRQAVHGLMQAPDNPGLGGFQILHLIDQQAERTLPALRREHLPEAPNPAGGAVSAAQAPPTPLMPMLPLRVSVRRNRSARRGVETGRNGLRDAIRLRKLLQIDGEDMRRFPAGPRPFLLQMGEQGGLPAPGAPCTRRVAPADRCPACAWRSALAAARSISSISPARPTKNSARSRSDRLAEEAQPFEVRIAAPRIVRHGRPCLRRAVRGGCGSRCARSGPRRA